MVVNVTGYTMFMTSQHDVIFWRLALVWRILLTQRAYYSTHTLLSRYCSLQCVIVTHIN